MGQHEIDSEKRFRQTLPDAVVFIGDSVHWGEQTREEYAGVLASAVARYKAEPIPEPTAALYHDADLGGWPLLAMFMVVHVGARTTEFCLAG